MTLHVASEDKSWLKSTVSSETRKLASTMGKGLAPKINSAFIKAGLDGNGRLTIGAAINKINEVLGPIGYAVPAQNGQDFIAQSGNKNLEIWNSDLTEMVENKMIHISWYRFNEVATDDVCEVIAYLT